MICSSVGCINSSITVNFRLYKGCVRNAFGKGLVIMTIKGNSGNVSILSQQVPDRYNLEIICLNQLNAQFFVMVEMKC